MRGNLVLGVNAVDDVKVLTLIFLLLTAWLGVALVNVIVAGTASLDRNTLIAAAFILPAWAAAGVRMLGRKCPCGCGRRVPLMKGGAAKQYPRVVEGVKTLTGIIAEAEAEGLDAGGLRDCLGQGDRIEADLLAHLHKQATPATHPDLVQLARAIRSWDGQCMQAITTLAASRDRPG